MEFLRKKFHFYSRMLLSDFERNSHVRCGVWELFCCTLPQAQTNWSIYAMRIFQRLIQRPITLLTARMLSLVGYEGSTIQWYLLVGFFRVNGSMSVLEYWIRLEVDQNTFPTPYRTPKSLLWARRKRKRENGIFFSKIPNHQSTLVGMH